MSAENYMGKVIIATLEIEQSFTAEVAPIGGPDTLLSFTLKDEPLSAAAVKLFVGTIASGLMKLMYQGIHYRVDVPNRRLYWLGTAPFPLTSTSALAVVFYGKGKYL